jgi:hypothetical protein
MAKTKEEIKPVDWDALKAPFDQNDVKYRIQSMTGDQTKALMLPYVDSRGVQDRLDAVLGPENWKDEYIEWQMPGVQLDPMAAQTAGWDSYKNQEDKKQAAHFIDEYYQKGVKCRLSIRVGDEWITKEDGAANTSIEGVKGGISQALRRAAVKFGIGRYLYNLPDLWIPIQAAYVDGKESAYYKGSYRYYSKPDLTRFTGPVGGNTGTAGNAASGGKSATEVINQAGTGTQANTSQSGSVLENAEHGGPQAISTAEIRDYQSRIAPFAQNNPTAQQMIGLSAKEKDSMGKISKLLGAAYNIFEAGSKEQTDITKVMEDKQLPDMVTVLKNSIVVLEGRK